MATYPGTSALFQWPTRDGLTFFLFHSISLPALGETDTGIEFNTDMPLEIYSTIETAFYVWLWGQIKRYVLDAVVSTKDL